MDVPGLGVEKLEYQRKIINQWSVPKFETKMGLLIELPGSMVLSVGWVDGFSVGTLASLHLLNITHPQITLVVRRIRNQTNKKALVKSL